MKEENQSIIKKEIKLIALAFISTSGLVIASLLLSGKEINVKAIILICALFLIMLIGIRVIRFRYIHEKPLNEKDKKKIKQRYAKFYLMTGVIITIFFGINLLNGNKTPRVIMEIILGLLFILVGATILIKNRYFKKD